MTLSPQQLKWILSGYEVGNFLWSTGENNLVQVESTNETILRGCLMWSSDPYETKRSKKLHNRVTHLLNPFNPVSIHKSFYWLSSSGGCARKITEGTETAHRMTKLTTFWCFLVIVEAVRMICVTSRATRPSASHYGYPCAKSVLWSTELEISINSVSVSFSGCCFSVGSQFTSLQLLNAQFVAPCELRGLHGAQFLQRWRQKSAIQSFRWLCRLNSGYKLSNTIT